MPSFEGLNTVVLCAAQKPERWQAVSPQMPELKSDIDLVLNNPVHQQNMACLVRHQPTSEALCSSLLNALTQKRALSKTHEIESESLFTKERLRHHVQRPTCLSEED